MFYEPKRDCFAYDPRSNDCEALNCLYCKTEGKCAFYKPEDIGHANGPIEHTEGYYKFRLQQYFDEHYGKYADEAEFFEDPAYNTWEFYIPSRSEVIKLKCSPIGRVTVLRKAVGKKHDN